MKFRIFPIAAAALLGIGLAACNDDSNTDFPPKPEQDIAAAPKVVSTLPEADVMNASTTSVITIEYDRPIYLTPITTVSVNGVFIDEGVTVEGDRRLLIPYQTMPNTRYTVQVSNPTVRDENYNFSPTFAYSFTTKGLNVLDPEMFDPAAAPVNTAATAQTVKLYQVLKENFGSRVISGAVAGGCHDIRMANVMAGMSGGKFPVINCFDFMEHYQSAPVNPKGWSTANYLDATVDRDWMAKGGIVSYQWHWFVPQGEGSKDDFSKYAFYCNGAGSTNTSFSVVNALTEGTWERAIIDRDIDAIASYLLNLQAEGIPVLWRPLHEAAGNTNLYDGGKAWFWWGNDGAEAFKQLWVYLYDRLKAKGVNNLLWVWTSCGNDPEWYPGDEYVDVVGLDYYENDPEKYHLSLADKMGFLLTITNHKIFALSEAGALPSPEARAEGGDMWAYSIPWNGKYTTDPSINSPSFFREFLSHELVLSRDEMTPIK